MGCGALLDEELLEELLEVEDEIELLLALLITGAILVGITGAVEPPPPPPPPPHAVKFTASANKIKVLAFITFTPLCAVCV